MNELPLFSRYSHFLARYYVIGKCMFNFKIVLAIIAAISGFFLNFSFFFKVAEVVANIFVDFLKLVSLPMIFFSIISTISGFRNSSNVSKLTKKTFIYCFTTTAIAAIVSSCIYFLVDPVRFSELRSELAEIKTINSYNYLSYIISILPSNFIKVFLENNMIGCTILAFLVGYSSLNLQNNKHVIVHTLVSSICDILFQISKLILKFMPIAVWAFFTIFLHSLGANNYSYNIIGYFVCILLANFIQAFIVLPLFLRYKKISVFETMRAVIPVFVVAFFSKSSTATLPTTMQYLKNDLKVQDKVNSLVLPMCTAINMNACAAFIFTTVIFVSEMNGYSFSFFQILLWIFLSIIAALGNAGVPMGCYFMATSYLVSINMPLNIMFLILPLYSILDMFETVINVWSDICITRIIDKEYVFQESNDMNH